LDENWDECFENITLAGTGASAYTTKTFIRLNRCFVSEVGTYGGSNVGDINLEAEGSTGTTRLIIVAGEGQTQLCTFTVPRDNKINITQLGVGLNRSSGAASNASFELFSRSRADKTGSDFEAFRSRFTINTGLGYIIIPLKETPLEFGGFTDIEMRCTFVSASNSIVQAQFDYEIYKDGNGFFAAFS